MALYTVLYTHEVGGQGLCQQVLVLVCVGNRRCESAYMYLPLMTV